MQDALLVVRTVLHQNAKRPRKGTVLNERRQNTIQVLTKTAEARKVKVQLALRSPAKELLPQEPNVCTKVCKNSGRAAGVQEARKRLGVHTMLRPLLHATADCASMESDSKVMGLKLRRSTSSQGGNALGTKSLQGSQPEKTRS